MSKSVQNLNMFSVPDNISGLNYGLLRDTEKNYVLYLEFLSEYQDFQTESKKILTKFTPQNAQISNLEILESPENNGCYLRLVPPYNAPCSQSNAGCLKKAAFKNTNDSNLYCWFHVNCQNK